MGKRSFTKRVVKKIKKVLNPKEAEEVIRKEFIDSRGNKMNMTIDVTPQKINEPTVEWNRKYNKE